MNDGLEPETVDVILENRRLTAENAALRQQLAEARAEQAWVRVKLKLPEAAESHEVYCEMHVLEAHAHGYTKYIEAYKCDDKQGEIARQSVQLAAQSAEIERLRKELSLERAANVRWPIKRVEQTTPRNCGQACLAMVLDVPIDDVPKEASAEFWDANAVQEWLSGFGLQEIRVRCFDQSIWPANDVRCIVDGPSPRGEKMHAVVCTMQGPQGWVLDADPHPDNTGLADEPYSATFFAIKDPAAYIKERAELATLRERLEAAEKELGHAERWAAYIYDKSMKPGKCIGNHLDDIRKVLGKPVEKRTR